MNEHSKSKTDDNAKLLKIKDDLVLTLSNILKFKEIEVKIF